MDLDDFAEFRVSIKDTKHLSLRHHNCTNTFVETIDLDPPFLECNIKWLMLRATTHWQEVHDNGT